MKKKKKARNWTKEKIELFARVIADDPYTDYPNALEKKALKKEAIAEVFESILVDFQRKRELEDENFIYENERNNFLEKKWSVFTLRTAATISGCSPVQVQKIKSKVDKLFLLCDEQILHTKIFFLNFYLNYNNYIEAQ